MVIETTCNKLYFVTDFAEPNLSHVWKGLRCKKTKGGYVIKDGAKPEMVRKEGSKRVA